MRALFFLALIALAVYTAVDCAQSPAYRRGSAPKWLWLTIVIVLPGMGPILWLIVSRTAKRPVPTAPDDDPEFLRYLAQRTAHGSSQPSSPGAGTSSTTAKNPHEAPAKKDGSLVEDDDDPAPTSDPTQGSASDTDGPSSNSRGDSSN